MTGIKPRFFEIARAASRKSNAEDRLKMGAVIVKGGRVISIGFNRRDQTHTKAGGYRNAIHAEFDALRDVPEHLLIDADIFIYRELQTGLPALARPCKFCMEKLRNAGIRRAYYTTELGTFKERLV